jgi:Holliday junction resolvase RusA-like endonuclease
MMLTIPIKPLSVNEAWQGKRYKTAKYKRYCQDIHMILPKNIELPDGKFGIRVHFYFSNAASDWDNPIKTTQDAICSYYGLNDSNMYLGIVEKFLCNKGEEKIEFEIFPYK